ncbi:hypothetical protein [Enterococcus olivae]
MDTHVARIFKHHKIVEENGAAKQIEERVKAISQQDTEEEHTTS